MNAAWRGFAGAFVVFLLIYIVVQRDKDKIKEKAFIEENNPIIIAETAVKKRNI